MHRRSLLVGYLLTTLAPISVGTGVVATAFLGRYPILTGQGLRYLAGAIILLPFAKKHLHRIFSLQLLDLLTLVALSVSGLVVFSVAIVHGVRSASPALVGDVVGCAPLLIGALEAIFSRRRPSKWIIIGAVFVTLGTTLVSGIGVARGVGGLAWALLALLGDAIFTLFATRLLPKVGAYNLAFATTALAAVILLTLGALGNRTAIPLPSQHVLLSLVYLAVVVSVGAFLAWFGGLERVPVSNAALFLGLTPLASLGGQVLVLDYSISRLSLLGTLLVVIGITVGIAHGARIHRASTPDDLNPRRGLES